MNLCTIGLHRYGEWQLHNGKNPNGTWPYIHIGCNNPANPCYIQKKKMCSCGKLKWRKVHKMDEFRKLGGEWYPGRDVSRAMLFRLHDTS